MAKYAIPVVKLTYVADSASFPRQRISASKQAAELIRGSYEDGEIDYQEYFKVMYLNRGNNVLGIHLLSIGGTASTVVDLKVLFTGALLANASAIIVAHNHPSGNLLPSPEDDKLTQKIAEAGKLLGITLHDHIILTRDGYYSYCDNGRLKLN